MQKQQKPALLCSFFARVSCNKNEIGCEHGKESKIHTVTNGLKMFCYKLLI